VTTPTTADHEAAKRLAAFAQLDAAPWQLEHLAAAIAADRAEAYADGRRDALDLAGVIAVEMRRRPASTRCDEPFPFAARARARCELSLGHDGFHEAAEPAGAWA
jgi:hypothetical protein